MPWFIPYNFGDNKAKNKFNQKVSNLGSTKKVASKRQTRH